MHLVSNRHSTMCCTTAKYGGQESFIFFLNHLWRFAFCCTLTLILTGEGEVGAPSREVALAWGDMVRVRVRGGHRILGLYELVFLRIC